MIKTPKTDIKKTDIKKNDYKEKKIKEKKVKEKKIKNNKEINTNEKVVGSGKKRSIRTIILAFSIIPVIILGVGIMFLFNTMLSSSTDKDTIEHLKGSALTVLTSYNQNPGDYIAGVGGGLWKGNFSICDSNELIDSIGEAAGIDIFFYSNEACMVSTLENVDETNMAFP